MSDVLKDVADGDIIDCCVTFVSKRLIAMVDDERVSVLRVEIGDYQYQLVLGSDRRSLARGWQVGDSRQLNAILVCRSNESELSGNCPACGQQSRTQSAHAIDISSAVRDVIQTLDDSIILVATSETRIHTESTHDTRCG